MSCSKVAASDHLVLIDLLGLNTNTIEETLVRSGSAQREAWNRDVAA